MNVYSLENKHDICSLKGLCSCKMTALGLCYLVIVYEPSQNIHVNN